MATDTARCPRCGGRILGTIADAGDRLEVEEVEQGRTVEDIAGELQGRRRRWLRKPAIVVAVGVLVVGFLGYGDKIPKPSKIADVDAYSSRMVRVTGEVLYRLDEGSYLADQEREIAPFSISDGTGALDVWGRRSEVEAEIRKGKHVRVWGHFERVTVRTGEHVEDERFFVATSLSID